MAPARSARFEVGETESHMERRLCVQHCFLDAYSVERLQLLLPDSVPQDAWELIVSWLAYSLAACVQRAGRVPHAPCMAHKNRRSISFPRPFGPSLSGAVHS